MWRCSNKEVGDEDDDKEKGYDKKEEKVEKRDSNEIVDIIDIRSRVCIGKEKNEGLV